MKRGSGVTSGGRGVSGKKQQTNLKPEHASHRKATGNIHPEVAPCDLETPGDWEGALVMGMLHW